MKVIQEFKITDETFSQFTNKYKEIITDIKKLGYRCFLPTGMSPLYVEGEHDKIKYQVFQILGKYDVKAQSGIVIIEVI